MTKRYPGEVILARWTVDPARVRDFAQRVQARYAAAPVPPHDILKACKEGSQTGLEVVCREDGIFVGRKCLAFDYNVVTRLSLEEHWILCELDWGAGDYLIPIPADRTEPARIVSHYLSEWREENRRYLEQRQKPTWNNRLLNIAEAHFPWVVLGLFFVVLPLILFLLNLLHNAFSAGR